jgi:tRNA(Ile)-lysidine synthetase-like protein
MSSIEKQLQAKLDEVFSQRQVSVERGFTLAYSGGPDSTALLYLMSEKAEKRSFPLRAAYVDHGIRSPEERAAEMKVVLSSVERLKIPLWCFWVPPRCIETASAVEGGIEAAARKVRYRFFERLVKLGGVVLLAHTRDDTIETQIMRFFQGSGPAGLSGIPVERGPFLRPLLSVKKEEIYRFLQDRGIEYSVDSSNEKGDYLRNRLRHELLPKLREIFPGIDRAMGESALKMSAAANLPTAAPLTVPSSPEAKRKVSGPRSAIKLSWRKESEGVYSFRREIFLSKPEAVRSALIYSLWDELHSAMPVRLPHRFVREIRRFIEEDAGAVLTGHGLRFSKEGNRIFCRQTVVRERKKGYLTSREEGMVLFPFGKSVYVSLRCSAGAVVRLFSETGAGPVLMRNPRRGDTLAREGGTVGLSKVFSEIGVSPAERWKFPVVEDKRGILALLRFDDAEAGISSYVLPLGREESDNSLPLYLREG